MFEQIFTSCKFNLPLDEDEYENDASLFKEEAKNSSQFPIANYAQPDYFFESFNLKSENRCENFYELLQAERKKYEEEKKDKSKSQKISEPEEIEIFEKEVEIFIPNESEDKGEIEKEEKNEQHEQPVKNKSKKNSPPIFHTFKLPRKVKRKGNNFTKKKRGRKSLNENKVKIHDKMSRDNILRKVQIDYLTFLIKFLNVIIKRFDQTADLFFLPLDYKFKKTVNKDFLNDLTKSSIYSIVVTAKISKKFRNYNIDYNSQVMSLIDEKCPSLIEFMKNNFYLDFFRNVYYQKERSINLNKFGLDKIVLLPKNVKLFQDFALKTDFEYDNEDREKYLMKIKECIEKKFLKKPKFLCL